MLAVGMLVGCTAPLNTKVADPTAASDAHSFRTKPGLAKVYFVGGRMGASMTLKADMPGGAMLLIDGNHVGQMDKNEVLVVDVVPKQYNFSWKYPAGDSQMQFLSRQVNAGDILILQANWNTGGSGFGLIGLAVSPAKYEINVVTNRGLVEGKRVVSHTSCPTSICK